MESVNSGANSYSRKNDFRYKKLYLDIINPSIVFYLILRFLFITQKSMNIILNENNFIHLDSIFRE